MKRLAIGLLVVALLAGCRSWAADLQKGYTFADGQRVTASQLSSLVDAATILPGFYTGKSAESTLLSSDYFLVYSPSLVGFRKVTADYALYSNTNLITQQVQKSAPATNDWLLIYDTAGGVLKKVAAADLGLSSTNLIAGQPLATNLNGANTFLLVLNYGTNAQVALSNLFSKFDYSAAFTNLAAHTAPTNGDQLLIWDRLAGTNKTTTLAGVFTNLLSVPTNAGADTVLIWSTLSNAPSKLSLSALQQSWSNNVVAPTISNATFTSGEIDIHLPGVAYTNSHTLGMQPSFVRWVLVCKTNELGYIAGDEVEAHNINDFANNVESAFCFWINTTNYGVVVRSTLQHYQAAERITSIGSAQNINTNNWRLKMYARP